MQQQLFYEFHEPFSFIVILRCLSNSKKAKNLLGWIIEKTKHPRPGPLPSIHPYFQVWLSHLCECCRLRMPVARWCAAAPAPLWIDSIPTPATVRRRRRTPTPSSNPRDPLFRIVRNSSSSPRQCGNPNGKTRVWQTTISTSSVRRYLLTQARGEPNKLLWY